MALVCLAAPVTTGTGLVEFDSAPCIHWLQ